VLTTTDVERSDQHILRPGRVDKSVKFTLATMADAKALFLLTFENQEELSNRFAEITGEMEMPHSLLASIIDANSTDARMAVFELLKKRQEIDRK
jgi:ATP-dependent 26S proteasome regulatory subunit